MKTIRLLRVLLGLCALCVVIVTAGCSVTGFGSKLQEWEKLGISEATVTGKFSNTSYKVEEKDGVREATLDHNNAWLPRVKVVRRTPADPKP